MRAGPLACGTCRRCVVMKASTIGDIGNQESTSTEPPALWTLRVADAAETLIEILRAGPAGVLAQLGISDVSAPRVTAGGVLVFVVTAVVNGDSPGDTSGRGTMTHIVVRDLRQHYHGTRPNDATLVADLVVSEVINYRGLVYDGVSWQ